MRYVRKTILTFVSLAAICAVPARAAVVFDLVDYNGSVRGTPAELGFKTAANYWSSVLTSNATIRLEIGYNSLPAGVIGSTGSTAYIVSTRDIYGQLAGTGDSALDRQAVAGLRPLTLAGGLQMITSGYDNDATKIGIDVTKSVFDKDDSVNNLSMRVNGATLKALGYTGFNPLQRDAQVNFSTNFAFDFDPRDGIRRDTFDFLGVAIHEIGHALGFVSGVDIYDNPANVNNSLVNINGAAIFSTLDLFRYSGDPRDVAPGTGSALDLAVGSPTYFSIDGGQNSLFGESRFSTGRSFGDGQQASHFKDLGGCTGQIGIMDPNFCFGQMGEVTASDIAAYDALGFNVGFDVLARPGYRMTSAMIFEQVSGVPEPDTWAMMLMGFGAVGCSLRSSRPRKRTTYIAA